MAEALVDDGVPAGLLAEFARIAGRPVTAAQVEDLIHAVRAVLDRKPVVSPVSGQGLALDEAFKVQEAVKRLRIEADARDMLAVERHAATWAPPADPGNLTAELALPDEGPRWRLRGLLGVGHNAILVAGRKAGKTTMVNNLVRCYADGAPFLGHFEVAPADAGVAVFNYEVDDRQYRQWLREAGIANTDRVFHLPLRGRSLPLKDRHVRAWVTAWLRERGIGLWILDPYSRAYVGSVADGNHESDVGPFLDTLDVIKAEAGVGELVMPVHTPKARAEAGEETAIGSQRLEAWPDAIWYLTREVITGARFLRAEGRDVDLRESPLIFESGSRALALDIFGGDRRQVREQHEGTAHRAAILSALREGAASGLSQRELSERTGLSRQKVMPAVARMVSAGEIHTVDGPNRSRLHRLGAAPAAEMEEGE